MGTSAGMMPLNLPGGSTLQGLMCLAPFVIFFQSSGDWCS